MTPTTPLQRALVAERLARVCGARADAAAVEAAIAALGPDMWAHSDRDVWRAATGDQPWPYGEAVQDLPCHLHPGDRPGTGAVTLTPDTAIGDARLDGCREVHDADGRFRGWVTTAEAGGWVPVAPDGDPCLWAGEPAPTRKAAIARLLAAGPHSPGAGADGGLPRRRQTMTYYRVTDNTRDLAVVKAESELAACEAVHAARGGDWDALFAEEIRADLRHRVATPAEALWARAQRLEGEGEPPPPDVEATYLEALRQREDTLVVFIERTTVRRARAWMVADVNGAWAVPCRVTGPAGFDVTLQPDGWHFEGAGDEGDAWGEGAFSPAYADPYEAEGALSAYLARQAAELHDEEV
jgi:hypothetical protein